MCRPIASMLLVAAAAFFCAPVKAQQATAIKDETQQGMLAAQIRTQGFTCDKPLGARKDQKLSKPDYAVWVLKCSNANYRVSRAPDMAAKVEPLR
nr:hypothetical protein FNV92_04230 [Bradyrhizobium cosmicum]